MSYKQLAETFLGIILLIAIFILVTLSCFNFITVNEYKDIKKRYCTSSDINKLEACMKTSLETLLEENGIIQRRIKNGSN